MNLFKKHYILITLYLLAALFIRWLYLYEYSSSPLFSIPLGPDVQEYSHWAKEILAGNFLWTKVHIHAPLYAYFLAFQYWIFSFDFYYIRAFQLLLGFLAVIPLTGSLLILSRSPSNITFSPFHITVFLLFWAWYPPLIYYQAELTSESLIIPLICTAVFLLYKGERRSQKDSATSCFYFGGAGILCGLSALLHPMTLFFTVFESCYLLMRNLVFDEKKSIKRYYPVIFIIAAAAVIAPVGIYNAAVLGKFTLIQANSGFNLYLGNNPDANGTCYLRPGPEWDKIHREAEEQAAKSGSSKDSYFIKKTVNFIGSNPFKWFKLLTVKTVYPWNYRELTAGADLLPLRYFTIFQRTFKLSFGLCAVLAFSLLLSNLRNQSFFRNYRHFLMLLLSIWFAQIIFETSGRYRVTMLPAILVFASLMIDFVIHTDFKDDKSRLIILLSIFIAVFIVFTPSPAVDEISEKAESETILGEALLQSGKIKQAKTLLTSSSKVMENWSRNYNLLGMIAQKEKKFKKAETYYLKAEECDRSDPDAPMNLAVLYSSQNMNDKAEKYFLEAFELDRTSPSLNYNYALYLYKEGKYKEAEKSYQSCLEIDPSYIMAINNLGIIYLHNKEYNESIDLFRKALKLDPKNPKRTVNLALAYLENGNIIKARKYLEKTVKLGREPEIQTARELLLKIKN